MTHQLLLEKIIKKAVKGGYCPTDSGDPIFDHSFAKAYFGEEDLWYKTPCDRPQECQMVRVHTTDDLHLAECARALSLRGYKFHLKKLALTPPEERLNYLQIFL